MKILGAIIDATVPPMRQANIRNAHCPIEHNSVHAPPLNNT
jgi:hypothetical protein